MLTHSEYLSFNYFDKDFCHFQTTEVTTPKEYVCQFCYLLLKKATELPCSHAYCKDCLVRWEEKKVQEYNNENEKEENRK